MEQLIEIQWTTDSLDEARRVCRYLVQEKIVACAQIIPWVESIFLWNSALDVAQESKVLFKTSIDRFDQVKSTILENTTYEVPEITFHKLQGGHKEYLSWVRENSSLIKN